jgi:OOP family OmpA-OmpF porin
MKPLSILATRTLQRLAAWSSCLTLLLAGAAPAQSLALPSIELERLELNPSGVGSLVLGTGELLPKGAWRLNVAAHYERDPLVLYRDDERVGAMVSSRVTAHVAGAWAVTRQLELGLQLPIVVSQRGEALSLMNAEGMSGAGMATPVLSARLGLLSEQQGQPLDLALELGAGLPVGTGSLLAREAGLRVAPRVMVGRRFGWLRGAVDLGMHVRPARALSDDAHVADERGSELRLATALVTTGSGLRGELSARASVPVAREGFALEMMAGARVPLTEWVEGYALAGPGFGSAPGTPAFRMLLGVTVGRAIPECAPSSKHRPEQCPLLDDDHDGVINRDDSCPLEVGLRERQGCPLKDADGDTIEDARDVCPTEAGLPERQGCPLKDADGDTIEDARDACPTEVGSLDRQGCPLKDADGDSIEDGKDACPTEAGPSERQGCPVKDTDGDTIEDTKDACPTEPGTAELRGCPVKDSDADEVPDHKDNCPKEKGLAGNQGCPASQKQLVEITRDRIIIADKVYFDTGKATIRSRSFPVLDQVARVLVEHPEVPMVVVEGHTDNAGSADANRVLSQQRADAVRSYLIQKGVVSSRLEAKGYGPDRPIDTNSTAEGKANNRRVEFIIQNLPQSAQPAPQPAPSAQQ